MNDDKPLVSLRMELVGNAVIAILCAVGAALIGEQTDTKIAARAGLALCYVSALLATYKIILAPRYRGRLNRVLDAIEMTEKERDLRRFDIYSEEQKKEVESSFSQKLEKEYQEFQYFYSFDERARANLIVSLILIAIGSVLQIYGAT
ncbi:hypothetical protein LG409_13490 [Halomonas sp. NyZ770]|uniref:hypothetical protein n=1 Tax=Halomonas sp. NyZ770 TaxID=2883106 RepID=UPI001D0B81FE|nr:hypothetical protein [Halomonas sp. NyZ770]UDM06386.1 hypothetical protein LG409_13490 [Halomonas sp. NyZ770]